jgi:condensin complex subunit 1
LENKNIRFDIENPIFHKLQEIIEHPCRSRDWFGVAEQAINTIYSLAHHPDIICDKIIKNLTVRAFTPRSKKSAHSRTPDPDAGSQAGSDQDDNQGEKEKDSDAMDEDEENPEADASKGSDDTVMQDAAAQNESSSNDVGDNFELAQMLFVVGHVAIKHIVYLEQVEREWKRQKDIKDKDDKEKGVS